MFIDEGSLARNVRTITVPFQSASFDQIGLSFVFRPSRVSSSMKRKRFPGSAERIRMAWIIQPRYLSKPLSNQETVGGYRITRNSTLSRDSLRSLDN